MGRKSKKMNKSSKIIMKIIISLSVLTALYFIYSWYFTEEIKHQSIPEKFQKRWEILHERAQRKAKSNDTEKQFEFIYDVYDAIQNADSSSMILEYGYVPYLVKFLNSPNSTIQEESVITLFFLTNNITNGHEIIVAEGAVPPLLELMHSSNEVIAKASLQTLNLLIYQKPKLASKILKMGLDKNLLQLINSKPSTEVLKNASEVLLNLCKNKNPSIPRESAAILLPTVMKLLRHSDVEIIKNAIASFYFLTEKNYERYKFIFDAEMIKIFIRLLDHKDLKIRSSAVTVLINIVSDRQSQIEEIDDEILEELPTLVANSEDVNVVQIALGLIQMYIEFSPNQHISALFEEDLIPIIIDKLADENLRIQNQAAGLLYFVVEYGTKKEISTLINMQIIPKLYNILVETKEDEITKMILHAFEIILNRSDPKMEKKIYNEFKKMDALKTFSKLGKYKKDEI